MFYSPSTIFIRQKEIKQVDRKDPNRKILFYIIYFADMIYILSMMVTLSRG